MTSMDPNLPFRLRFPLRLTLSNYRIRSTWVALLDLEDNPPPLLGIR